MRTTLVALLVGVTTIFAQQPTLPDVPGLSLDDNPPCALPCLLGGLNQTNCPTNDQTCLCQDDDFIKFVEGCVVMSCPLKYAIITQNITWTACDFPLHNEVPATKVARIVLFAMLPTLAIILRLITKFARLSPWGWDDYTIIVAYIILVAYVSLHVFLEDNGAGRDLWTLSDSEITHFFKVFDACRVSADVISSGFYALQTLYHSCIDIIKASILFMYLRIFHLPGEKITIALWVTQALNLMNGVIFIFVGLFQCNPVSLAWTFWTGDATGKCLNIVYLALAHAGINIALDVWMLILPLTQVWGMNLARRKKFAIMFMFSLGLFLTVVSCIRIKAILDFRKDPLNPTVAMMPSVIWTDLELYVGIFTACIPTLRQFFVRFILQQSEKKKRLSSAAAEYRSSMLTPKKGGSQQMSELDTIDESSHHNSP
ncbi:CFEM domain-containing protein [Colletotrichum costaricense]|uniref:CFEM domain-containing protein n=1 Tax=Colletotrichum costaricense TaxID=1209916 RepID=A0AAI9YZS6_9PEZI|nr:CFEM domain-containing protein [Colletotrichum costaricense]KAK1529309.1 CFEM domain-containing protein [Colletotrichum costaricense]